MKDLEELLRKMEEPPAAADSFRQRLRRRLLDPALYRTQAASPWKAAFTLSAAATLLLGAVLVLFVARPSYPLKIHWALVSGRASMPDGLGAKEAGSKTRSAKETARPLLDAKQLLAADRDFVNAWARQTLKAKPASIQAVDPVETYTVSRFRLDDGKFVRVYTRIPVSQEVRRVSY